jgi:hypothetical protein
MTNPDKSIRIMLLKMLLSDIKAKIVEDPATAIQQIDFYLNQLSHEAAENESENAESNEN